MFSETVQAAAVGLNVNAALLCFMNFKDAPRRWWMGFGTLDAGGYQWQGLGEMVSIDGLGAAFGTAAPPTTFTLSGVDAEIVAIARNASDRVKNRRVVVYVQFFHGGSNTDGEVWGLLDTPQAIWSGRMDQVKFAAQGPSERSIAVTAESIWADRNRPPFGLYTHQDQVSRYPGDLGLKQVASLVNKTIVWPDF